eukprot:4261298-Ditylum_brightwellii.AAC.1
MKKSNENSDAWFETPLIILDKDVVNYFLDHEGNMTTYVKSHVDDACRWLISIFLKTKESMKVTQKVAIFSGDGEVSHSNMMDVDDTRYNIDRLRLEMDGMSKTFEASQNVGINKIANIFHMMQMQQSKTEQMLQKIATFATAPQVEAKSSEDSRDD